MQHIEVTYVVVQLCCLAVLMVISQRIARSPDDGEKMMIPEVVQCAARGLPASAPAPALTRPCYLPPLPLPREAPPKSPPG